MFNRSLHFDSFLSSTGDFNRILLRLSYSPKHLTHPFQLHRILPSQPTSRKPSSQ